MMCLKNTSWARGYDLSEDCQGVAFREVYRCCAPTGSNFENGALGSLFPETSSTCTGKGLNLVSGKMQCRGGSIFPETSSTCTGKSLNLVSGKMQCRGGSFFPETSANCTD
jgi:hypothetical protein